MSEQVTLYRTPRSAWLKASAAAVRSKDRIRAELWLELARDLERLEATIGQDRYSSAERAERSGATGNSDSSGWAI